MGSSEYATSDTLIRALDAQIREVNLQRFPLGPACAEVKTVSPHNFVWSLHCARDVLSRQYSLCQAGVMGRCNWHLCLIRGSSDRACACFGMQAETLSDSDASSNEVRANATPLAAALACIGCQAALTNTGCSVCHVGGLSSFTCCNTRPYGSLELLGGHRMPGLYSCVGVCGTLTSRLEAYATSAGR